MNKIDEMIKDEWRELDYFDSKKNLDKIEWQFYETKQGLFNFAMLLDK